MKPTSGSGGGAGVIEKGRTADASRDPDADPPIHPPKRRQAPAAELTYPARAAAFGYLERGYFSELEPNWNWLAHRFMGHSALRWAHVSSDPRPP
jgi:hypothetical protein